MWRRLLMLLQLLLLLDMFLRQLLRLLLVLLLDLLFLCVVRLSLLQLLVVLLLFLLEFLTFLILLGLQLVLLLLVFLVYVWVAGVWRGPAFVSGKVVGMDCIIGASRVVFWTSGAAVFGTRRRPMNRASFSGCNDSATFQLSRPGSGRDRRLAMVCGSAELWITSGGLHMLRLS